MGKLKELFTDNLDYFLDEEYHYKQWLKTRESEEEKEEKETKDNTNLNKG